MLTCILLTSKDHIFSLNYFSSRCRNAINIDISATKNLFTRPNSNGERLVTNTDARRFAIPFFPFDFLIFIALLSLVPL